MPWIFLILSGLLETCWILSLKYTQGFTRLVPTVLYTLFGLAAPLLLSLSLKTIPLSTAYSVWSASRSSAPWPRIRWSSGSRPGSCG